MSDGTRDSYEAWWLRHGSTADLLAAWDAGHAAGLAKAAAALRELISDYQPDYSAFVLRNIADRLSPEPPKGDQT